MTKATTHALGDPEVARRLTALAKHLPGGPPNERAMSIFSRRDSQNYIFNMIIRSNYRHVQDHPLYAAFDTSIDLDVAISYAEFHTFWRDFRSYFR